MEKKNLTEIVILRVDPDGRNRLEQAAKFDGVTVSEFVRRWIEKIPIVGRIEGDKVILNKE